MNPTKSDPPAWLRPISEPLSRLIHRWKNPSSDSDSPAPSDPTELARLVLRDALRENATDLHLEPNSKGWRLRLRIDGVLHDSAEVPTDLGQRLLQHLKSIAGLDPVTAYQPHDAHLSYELDDRRLDIRLACVPCQFGEKATLRILDPMRIRHRIEQLGLGADHMEEIRRWLGNMAGLCLVAGPTSSGKTTTLYALLQELQLVNRSIVTIEDPVEYLLDGITQVQVDDRRGLSFAEGLKSMLRLDPDYLLLGETRDHVSARIAVDASATGRVLMSTLHSRDAVGVVTTLRNWNITDAEIASSLELVIAQRLVRRLCEDCRREDAPSPAIKLWLDSIGVPAPSRIWQAVGCGNCHKSGYAGRVGIFELWHKTADDYDAILHHADERSLRQRLVRRRIHSLLDAGLEKASEGITSLEEVKGAGIHMVSRVAARSRPRRTSIRKKPAGKKTDPGPPAVRIRGDHSSK
jgi:general secretion pathway protein E